MRSRWIFCLLALWLISIPAAICASDTLRMWAASMMLSHPIASAAIYSSVPALLLILLYRVLIRPMEVISRGMHLVNGQDFGSRLAHVGQSEADYLVDVYNSMMNHLREERLTAQEKGLFLQALIDTSPLGIALLDFDGRIVSTNSAMRRFLGFTPAEGTLPSALDTAEGIALASVPDGSSKVIRFDSSTVVRIQRPGFMDHGARRPYLMVEWLTDEIMQAEKQAYSKVIRLMAHEVNNTLGGLGATLDMLADIHADMPDMVALIDSCRESTSDLTSFINGYATLARLPQPRMTNTPIDTLINGMLPFLESTAMPVKINARLHSGAIVYADPTLIRQAMVNIIKNSRESIGSAPNGMITISIEGRTLTITDNGQGISDEAASNLFSPFFTTKPTGQGLGLMLTADILKAHGCRFTLATGPDRLTRFTIHF